MAFWIEPRRQLGFMADLNDSTMHDFCFQLESHAETGKPFEILINSGGGGTANVTTYLQLVNGLRESGTVRTIGTGWVASAAVHMLAAGTKGERYVLGYDTYLMVHEVVFKWSREWLSTTEIEAKAADCRLFQDRSHQQLAALTGRPAAWWKELVEGKPDVMLTPVQAVEYGIADKIVDVLPPPLLPEKPFPVASKPKRWGWWYRERT